MLVRIARSMPGTLRHTFYAGDAETPLTLSGAPQVTVTTPDGAQVATGTATTDGVGGWTFALAGQPDLTELTQTWTGTLPDDAGQVVESGQVEICGGHFFSIRKGRDSDADLSDTDRYTTADLIQARLEVEQECEWICAQAFVPRWRRLRVDGTGTSDLVLPDGGDEVRGGVLLRGVRAVRAVTLFPRAGQAGVPLTGQQLAALTIRTGGALRRTDGTVWPAGDSNVVVDVEYGADRPPDDLVRAALTRFRSRAQLTKTQIPDRAVSFTVTEMGTYRLSLPDAFRTGIPEVDAAYGRYSRRVSASEAPGGRAVPASRTLTYTPQRYSLFHGR
jgi:hypothetical protein